MGEPRPQNVEGEEQREQIHIDEIFAEHPELGQAYTMITGMLDSLRGTDLSVEDQKAVDLAKRVLEAISTERDKREKLAKIRKEINLIESDLEIKQEIVKALDQL